MDAEAKQKRAIEVSRKKKLGGKQSKFKGYRKDRRCSCDWLEIRFSEKKITQYGKVIKRRGSFTDMVKKEKQLVQQEE